MNQTQLINHIKLIVIKAKELKDKYLDNKYLLIPVNYACIFAQNDSEYFNFENIISSFGKVIKQTPSGNLFYIEPIKTVSGDLFFLKNRKPDKTRKEMGDADFTIDNFKDFKKTYITKKGFVLIVRDNYEMIELTDINYNVRAYFSNPPINEQFIWRNSLF